jgi:hypothetical protein
MSGRHIKTIADIIHEQHSRYDRYNNGTGSDPAFDTTTEADDYRGEGDWTGDVRYGKNPTGKSGTHVRRQHTSTGDGEQ